MKKASKARVKARMQRQKNYKEGYLLMLDFLLGKKHSKINTKQNKSINNRKNKSRRNKMLNVMRSAPLGKSASGGKALITILLSILLSSANAQYNVNWVRYYEGPGMAGDKGNVVKTDAEGYIYVGGYIRTGNFIGSEDFCLIKYESNGQVAWQRSYNGPGDYIDLINDMVIDETGNIYVTGQSFGNNSHYDFCTIKYDSDGNLVWNKRYDNCSGNDAAMKILRAETDYIYVSGISENAQENFDICLIKYSANGTEQWIKKYDGTGIDILSSMAQDAYESTYLAGYTYNGVNKYDICLLKYSPNGDLIFTEKYDRGFQQNDVAHSITITGAGEIYIAGRSKNTSGDYDCALLKFGQNGNLLWDRFYNGTGNDYDQASSVCVDNQNNVIITGWCWGGPNSDDFITIKYNSEGSLIWEKRYDNIKNGQSSSDGADKIISDKDGNLFVMGVSDNDYMLISYNSAGSINYEYRFDGPCNGLEEPKDMCFDGNETILITGMSEHYTENTDICTIKIVNLVTAVNNQSGNIPSQFSLSQNCPNPFNPSTNINFSIPKAGHVKLVVFDLTGKQVAELVNGTFNAGTHEVKFDASKLSSDTYFYRIIADGYTDTKKMILIK